MPTNPKETRYFCIHGHFYQPPRENPALGKVEMQPSAWPAHDWNERVYLECYAPNAASRLLDEKGRIEDIWNNYAWMSFNAGATLLAWMEEQHPETYTRILEADQQSRSRLDGHGNAVAQVYSHTILPLGSAEDKRLQIAWGIRDFEQRFGRKPEGMWLAETAIDMATAIELIRQGIRYTILSPTQAWKVRPLGGETWQDVSDNTVDPKHPYRLFPLDADGTPLEKGFLDIFFYDGPLSSGVGFEHLLRDANRFADRIEGAFDPERTSPQLVSISTDGESYGHHEPFGDMCAAYLFKHLAPQKKMTPVNYGWWLSRNPPLHEVKIKNAYSGGTAWSCAHGTGRWSTDCGCNTGAAPGWNQKWRAPLRAAIDLVAEAATRHLAQNCQHYFRDPLLASAEAVDAWSFDPNRRESFWKHHLLPGVNEAEAQNLIEILRYSQYMYTSCGWFFADLTGIETVQVLHYAHPVLALLKGSDAYENLRKKFLEKLSEATSNVDGKNGRTLFEKLESESLSAPEHLALGMWVAELMEAPFPHSHVLGWTLQSHRSVHRGPWSFKEVVVSREFTQRLDRAWLAFHGDGLSESDYWLKTPMSTESLEEIRIDAELAGPSAIPSRFGWRAKPASSLPIDVRDRITQHLKNRYWIDSAPDFVIQNQKIRECQQKFARLEWPLPRSILACLHVIENHQMVEALSQGLAKSDVAEMQRALDIARSLVSQGERVHLGPVKDPLHRFMLGLGHRFIDHSAGIELKPLFVLLDLLDALKLNMERYRLENLAFPLFRSVIKWKETGHFSDRVPLEEALLLLDRLNFSIDAGTFDFKSGKAVNP